MSAVAELQRRSARSPVRLPRRRRTCRCWRTTQPVQTSTTFVTGECFNAFGVTPILGRGINAEEAPDHGRGRASRRHQPPAVDAHLPQRSRRCSASRCSSTTCRSRSSVCCRGLPGSRRRHTASTSSRRSTRCCPPARGRRQLASYLLGRLKPGVTLEAATAEIEARWPAVLQAVLPANMAPTERTQLMDSKPRLISHRHRHLAHRASATSQPLTLILGLTAPLLLSSPASTWAGCCWRA